MNRNEVLQELWIALGKPERYSDFQENMVEDLVSESVAWISSARNAEKQAKKSDDG